MVREFLKRSESVTWHFLWTFGDKPVVKFTNEKARTSVIYTADELKNILERSDDENSFIPVPREVLERAYKVVDKDSKKAA